MQDPAERREERDFHQPDREGPAGEPIKPAAQARQGVGSGRILTVLSVALVLVIIGFAATYMGMV
ncbi:hypothetical protein GCM10007301_37490 [Azorhizobium oxalatiphilum]|uniref:Uncharacterized protein n=1 Tax=Azorhizobium oxalatiphilum TaxID=980631 RepID=A0A917C6A6_9HYPH|nr:hypothetical protein [Azorhizobium oxalatiphilum]GGF74198.1 hypothetical protein GCM10007301_37490 [Azorhizobium oxalatiphilum]